MGVSNIITFDAHDPRVQNAIPLSGFDNIRPSYQMLKALTRAVPDVKFDPDNLVFNSPDEGAMGRSMYYSSVIGVGLGMFYKRRNYSVVIDGKNPIEAHEYLGPSVEGKDVVVVDDMISSGDSILDVSAQLKAKGARRVFLFVTFGLFVNGLESFDEAYKNGLIESVFTTNTIYQTPELLARPWYTSVDMSKFLAFILDAINHDVSIGGLLNPSEKINHILEEHKKQLADTEDTQMTFENI